MNISDKLRELWMSQLPKDETINGFSHVVTFVIPEYVQEILFKKYKLTEFPNVAIIRRWIVKWSWKSISRTPTRLTYSLAYYDGIDNKFRIVKDKTWKSVKRVLWSIREYITSEGDLFTAEKYIK